MRGVGLSTHTHLIGSRGGASQQQHPTPRHFVAPPGPAQACVDACRATWHDNGARATAYLYFSRVLVVQVIPKQVDVAHHAWRGSAPASARRQDGMLQPNPCEPQAVCAAGRPHHQGCRGLRSRASPASQPPSKKMASFARPHRSHRLTAAVTSGALGGRVPRVQHNECAFCTPKGLPGPGC